MDLLDNARVWDLTSGSQRYQFSSPEDRPTCVAYAPSKPSRGALSALEHNAMGQVPSASGRVSAAVGDGDGNGIGEDGGDGEGSSSSVVVESRRHLVGGYASGCLRVFDVPTTQTLYEFQQHHGLILQVRHECYARTLCVYKGGYNSNTCRGFVWCPGGF